MDPGGPPRGGPGGPPSARPLRGSQDNHGRLAVIARGLRPLRYLRGSRLGDFVLGNYLRRFKAVRVLGADSTTIKVCRIGAIAPVDNYRDVVVFDVDVSAIFSAKLFHCLASCLFRCCGGLRPRGSVVD